MAAARYLGNKKEGIISIMKLHYYSSSPSYAARVTSPSASQQKERIRGDHYLDDRDIDHDKSTIEHVEESAKAGVRKATEIADAAKQNLDEAWDSTKAKIMENTNNENEEDKVVDHIKKLDGPVDTVDYRNIKDSNL